MPRCFVSLEKVMPELQRLTGKHALLTGVGGGIGLAVTAAYLREGGTVHGGRSCRADLPKHCERCKRRFRSRCTT